MHAVTPVRPFKVVWTGCVWLGAALCLVMGIAGQLMHGLSALGFIAAVWAPAIALLSAALVWGLGLLMRR